MLPSFLLLAFLIPALGQDVPPQSEDNQAMSAMHGSMVMSSDSLIGLELQHSTSGTDAEPASTATEMIMAGRGRWLFMLHGI
ncbi:MAG: hypothetical protein JOZ44_06510, partial [Acidobacteria bacterium]|nr:hypothetical protein [Acidobacteriota bacterium]